MTTVADLLAAKPNRDIIAIKDSALLPEAAAVMAKHRIGILIVIGEDKRFRGILSERDLVKALAQHPAEVAALKVGQVATQTIRACVPSRSLESILESMEAGRYRHMPVLENEQIRGVISITDVLRFLSADVAQRSAEAPSPR